MKASARGGEEARAAQGQVDEGWEAEEEYGGQHEEGEVIDGRGRARLFEVDADRMGMLLHGSADVGVRTAEAEAAAFLDGGWRGRRCGLRQCGLRRRGLRRRCLRGVAGADGLDMLSICCILVAEAAVLMMASSGGSATACADTACAAPSARSIGEVGAAAVVKAGCATGATAAALKATCVG